MSSKAVLRVPKEWKGEFASHWKQLRLADALPPTADLRDAEEVDRFDGAALAEWIVPITAALSPIIVAALGFLVARKGEVEISDGKNVRKFRNLSPREIKEVMEVIEASKRNE